jgi:hypothetical protein
VSKPILDKETKKAISECRNIIQAAIKDDLNEADTSMRIERIFTALMGYDVFKHITKEHAVHGIGDTEYCDFAIKVDETTNTPSILIEVKRATSELSAKYLKQATSYAINIGCEWAILTNGNNWQLYHISFGQPPRTTLLDSWSLLDDAIEIVADKFSAIGYKNVKKGGLKQVWEKSNVLTAENVVRLLLSEEAISLVRRGIKKSTNVNVTPEEIVGAIRHLFNESALNEMDKVKICLPAKKPVKKAETVTIPKAESQTPTPDPSDKTT